MDDESTIAKLKKERTQLRAKLTANKNLLDKRAGDYKSSEKCFTQIEELYSSIYDVHFEYCELVNGMNLDEYLANIDTMYKEAATKFFGLKSKHMSRDVILAIQEAEYILSLDYTSLSANALNDKIESHVTYCKELSTQYTQLNSSDVNVIYRFSSIS